MLLPTSVPTKVKRLTSAAAHGTGLELEWSSGETVVLDSRFLRSQCPCASCQEKKGDASHAKPISGRRSALRVISSSSEQETDLAAVWAVGNYAVGIRWGDNHDSGIFTYELLREFSQKALDLKEKPRESS